MKCKLKGCSDQELRDELERREDWSKVEFILEFGYATSIRIRGSITREELVGELDAKTVKKLLKMTPLVTVNTI